ncbi:hypothetical protein CAEBREN_15865 [Caenorhabditis brenneri]|uniref:F-box domain-containing protein n=1 Tax=Caenorhabditis brenneri TaxID=135651 RepID=G0MR06_CAEBE|nr:hypothetical protein CAEBREN_15865 [Caenorhabditis brenneri]
MGERPSLATMPNELLKIIVEQAGYMSIQRLRLVNHAFQEFIEDSKLDYSLKEISIQLLFNQVSLTLKQGKDSDVIVYKQHEQGTEIQIGSLRVVKKEVNFLDLFFCVLKDVFKNQISTIGKLNIELIREWGSDWKERFLHANNYFVKRLQEMEGPEGQDQWRVSMIRVAGSHDHTKGILSMVDPNYLNRIEFVCNWNRLNRNNSEEIIDLVQWKSAKELYCLMGYCQGFRRLDVTKFSHFEKMEVNITTVTANELHQLIKSYIENPNFKSSVILYKNYQGDEPIDYIRARMAQNRYGQLEEEVENYYRIP